jgi:hypothetical protein
MSLTTTYNVFGPAATLRRMAPALLEEIKPKYLYQYKSDDEKEEISVAVYEEYHKQINASLTLTCVIECTDKKISFELTTTGGRVGFRGSSLDTDDTIDKHVGDFILDFGKRFGLSVQEVQDEEPEEEES